MENIVESYYRDNYRRLVKSLVRRAGSEENAEDIVQEAFARAIEFFHAYDQSRPFEGWFIRIMNNCLREYKVAERNHGMALRELEVDEEVEDNNNAQLYKRAAQYLIEKQGEDKEVLSLYFLKCYKTGEIAKIVGRPYRQVVEVIYQFKKELNDKLGG